jgi:hypothetical protein
MKYTGWGQNDLTSRASLALLREVYPVRVEQRVAAAAGHHLVGQVGLAGVS